MKEDNQNEYKFDPELLRKLIEQIYKLDQKLEFDFGEDNVLSEGKLAPSGFMIVRINKLLRNKDKIADFDSIFTEEEKKKIGKIISLYEDKEKK